MTSYIHGKDHVDMPAHRKVDIERVKTLVRQGLTHKEIAEVLTKETGEPITRQAVSVALHRAGLTENQPRYDDLLPWRVKMPHMRQYPALMLRAYGRRRSGIPLTDDMNHKLNLWLARLVEDEVVVDYDDDQGFIYVDKQQGEELIRTPRRASDLVLT